MPTVTMRIPDGSTRVYVEKADPKVYFQIYNLLTYKKDYGKWEKPESLYDPYTNSFPVGLVPRVRAFLKEKGYRVRVRDERIIRGEKLDSTWNEAYKLRKYQKKAIGKAIKAKMGVLALPVGSGKTIVGLGIVHKLGVSAIIIVHTKELLYQWAEKVREVLGIEAGIIGDNKWQIKRLLHLQTLVMVSLEKTFFM
jgi:replicative superfamily II helicase